MCELFGISSNRKLYANDYLKEFYQHSCKHPDGWGLAIMQKDKTVIKKEAHKASDSTYLKELLGNDIHAQNLFAHIRLATKGANNPLNCHPFKVTDNNDNEWILMHNGTMFNDEKLDKYKSLQLGDTDSERILLYVVDNLNKKEENNPLDEDELYNFVNALLTNLSIDNKLNLMIYTRGIIFVHTNTPDSLYYIKDDDSIIFSTQPLFDDAWKKTPMNRVFVLKDGQIVYRGKNHHNTYIIKEEHIDIILENISDIQKENLINEYGSMANLKRELLKIQG